MESLKFPFQWLQFISIILLFTTTTTSAARLDIPRLSPFRRSGTTQFGQSDVVSSSASTSSETLHTFYYTQTLDHFNYRPESYTTFRQRYVVSFDHWGGANVNAPIFAYLGAEAPLDDDLSAIGFLKDNAAHFKALLLYIEHRYYGKSIPFGSREEAYKNASTLGYFNSAQAIVDYAEIITYVKAIYRARHSPVILIGGSYGGMLASWLRLKHPHVALGTLASSAPILYFDNITRSGAYYSIVTKDFRQTSESCYKTIRRSWSVINKIASTPYGLSILSKQFKTCKPLNNASELKDHLATLYTGAAQYNNPPSYPVALICGGIDGSKKRDILGKIFDGMVAYSGNVSCYVNRPTPQSETDIGWSWQRCTEMIQPIGIGKKTMFEPDPYDLNSYIQWCKQRYGVTPRPHWVTSYYGGHDIELNLKRFGSNIIFSNGLRDPYSSGGVLENISENILAVTTVKGAHCLDILKKRDSDPEWLSEQRNREVKIIQGWLAKYYADLKAIQR